MNAKPVPANISEYKKLDQIVPMFGRKHSEPRIEKAGLIDDSALSYHSLTSQIFSI